MHVATRLWQARYDVACVLVPENPVGQAVAHQVYELCIAHTRPCKGDDARDLPRQLWLPAECQQ